MDVDSLSQLGDVEFYKLFDSVMEEHTKRNSKTKLNVYLSFRGTRFPVQGIEGNTKVEDLKETVQETVFHIANTAVPGPSATWEYLSDGKQVDDHASIARYADDEGAVVFVVAPKSTGKRKRVPRARKGDSDQPESKQPRHDAKRQSGAQTTNKS